MMWRFEWVYRMGLAALFFVALWAVWVNAHGAPVMPPPAAPAAKTNVVEQVTVTNSAGLLTVQTKVLSATWPILDVSFGLDQVPVLRDTTFLDQPLWKYVAFLLYIIFAFYIAKLIDLLVNAWLKRLTASTKTHQDDIVLDLLRGPVKMMAFVIFLDIGLGLFDWPQHAQLILSRALIVAVACSVTYLLLKLVDLLLDLWQEKIAAPQDQQFAKQLLPLVSKVSKTALLIAAVLLTADNLDIRITSALAGLSVGGLALGLAAQDTVANLFGAVAIFLDKPFYIGDTIRVEGVEGVVEGIGLRSTRVRNGDGHHVTIPNKLMGNAIITNITRRPAIKSQINLGLTYNTPATQVARAVALLEEIFRASPKTRDVIISFNKFGDSALNILIVHEWAGTDVKEHFATMQGLNLQVKERFDAERIEFAFPSQTIYLKQESAQMESPRPPATA